MTLKLLNFKSVWDVTNNMEIIRKYMILVSGSKIAEMQVIKFYPDLKAGSR